MPRPRTGVSGSIILDHCTAIEAVLAVGRVGQTYHVGSGVEASIMEIADLILATLGKPDSLKEIVPDRPGHDRRYLLDSTKLRTELGRTPSINWAGRTGRHGRVVRRQPGLVGTAAGARAPVVEGGWGGNG